jgi:hypothetical protein
MAEKIARFALLTDKGLNRFEQQTTTMHKRVGYYKRRKILSKANFLDLTPIHNYNYETNAAGQVTILIPRFTDWLGKHLLQPRLKHPFMKLSLDDLGSATWILSDGRRNVKEICNQLKKQFGKRIEPAEDRVTRFLSQLYMKKIILFKEILKI